MPPTRRWVKFPRLTLHRASGHPSNKLGCWTAPRLGSRFTQLVLSWSPCTVGFSWQLKLITQYKTPKCPMVGSAACNNIIKYILFEKSFKRYIVMRSQLLNVQLLYYCLTPSYYCIFVWRLFAFCIVNWLIQNYCLWCTRSWKEVAERAFPEFVCMHFDVVHRSKFCNLNSRNLVYRISRIKSCKSPKGACQHVHIRANRTFIRDMTAIVKYQSVTLL